MPDIYIASDGKTFDLDELELKYPQSMDLLRRQIKECTDWVSFQGRTTSHIIRTAQRTMGRSRWQEDPIYRLQLDLAGQLGVALGQMAGQNTESFLRFRAGL